MSKLQGVGFRGTADEALSVHKVMNGCGCSELPVYGLGLQRIPSESVQKGFYMLL